LHVLSEAHAYPVGHGVEAEQVFVQTPAEQWVGSEQVVVLFSLHSPVPSQERSSAAPVAEQSGAQVPLVLPAATLVQ
jgi:hypothetical protein